MLKRYAELGTTYRNEPCIEYPGVYMSFTNGRDAHMFDTHEEAYMDACKRQDDNDGMHDVSVCWQARDNDPRHGEVWFTGFYRIEVLHKYSY